MLGKLEAFSMLALFFVAMPIKYIGGNPVPVKWVGTAHGILFLMFIAFATEVARRDHWTWTRLFTAYAASVIPFGAFVLDRRMFPESSSLYSESRT